MVERNIDFLRSIFDTLCQNLLRYVVLYEKFDKNDLIEDVDIFTLNRFKDHQFIEFYNLLKKYQSKVFILPEGQTLFVLSECYNSHLKTYTLMKNM